MADRYSIYREDHKNGEAKKWVGLYKSLTPEENNEFQTIVFQNEFNDKTKSKYHKVNELISHYVRAKKTDNEEKNLKRVCND